MADRDLPGIRVYDPATISDAEAREIEESHRRVIDDDNTMGLVLHEVTFLRHDVARLRTKVNGLRWLLLLIAVGVGILLAMAA